MDTNTEKLRSAFLIGNIPLCMSLLEQGADPNGQTGSPLLWMAIQDGNVEFAKALLHYKADPHFQSSGMGQTYLIIATIKNQYEIVKLLVDLGVDLDKKDHRGATALTIAQEKKYHQIAQLLINSGANINVQPEDYVTYYGKTFGQLAGGMSRAVNSFIAGATGAPTPLTSNDTQSQKSNGADAREQTLIPLLAELVV